jgi:hypothetical protein
MRVGGILNGFNGLICRFSLIAGGRRSAMAVLGPDSRENSSGNAGQRGE